jgi:hypothetical protein
MRGSSEALMVKSADPSERRGPEIRAVQEKSGKKTAKRQQYMPHTARLAPEMFPVIVSSVVCIAEYPPYRAVSGFIPTQ